MTFNEHYSSRNVGTGGEEVAIEYLNQNGMEVIGRNYRLRDAEIDLIFKEWDNIPGYGPLEYIVFAEVKLRTTASHGHPWEAVDINKQRKIVRAARHFLYTHDFPSSTAVRFDVISIEGGAINHIRNAFLLT